MNRKLEKSLDRKVCDISVLCLCGYMWCSCVLEYVQNQSKEDPRPQENTCSVSAVKTKEQFFQMFFNVWTFLFKHVFSHLEGVRTAQVTFMYRDVNEPLLSFLIH